MDLAVIVAQVAVGGDRPQVDPLADVGVAQESLVILVGVTVDDRRLDLAADPAVGPIVTEPRRLARKSWVSAAIEHGPSIRVNGWTQTFGPSMIGPLSYRRPYTDRSVPYRESTAGPRAAPGPSSSSDDW